MENTIGANAIEQLDQQSQPPVSDMPPAGAPAATPCGCKKAQAEREMHMGLQSLAVLAIVVGLAVMIWKKVLNA